MEFGCTRNRHPAKGPVTWLTVLLLSSFICVFAFSQAEANSATQTSVCEIVRQPEQFEGKLLKVTAQIWTDYHQFWLNESVASSLRFNAFCGWLPAEFSHPTSLVGSRAFGTFTGRIIRDSRSSSRRVKFVIERQSDIYHQFEIQKEGPRKKSPEVRPRSANFYFTDSGNRPKVPSLTTSCLYNF